MRSCLIGACAVLAGLAGRVAAQEVAQADGASGTATGVQATQEATIIDRTQLDDRWKLRVEPGVWYLGLASELRMPGSSGPGVGNGEKIEVDELGVDSPNIVPTAEAHISFGPVYRASIRGAMNSDDQRNVVGRAGQIGDVLFAPTSELATTWDFSTFELELGARVHHTKSEHRSAAGLVPFESDIALFAGVQVIDLDIGVTRLAGGGPVPAVGDDRTSFESTWLLPRVGGKLEMRLYEEFTIDVTLALSSMPLGDSSASSLDIVVGFAWEPTENFGVQIGYRATEFDLSDGDGPEKFEFGGGNQGLQIGAVLRF